MKRRNFVRETAISSLAITSLAGAFIQTSSCSRKIEPKIASNEFINLSGFKPLNMEETQSEIIINGITFKYTICKITGLIIKAQVLGDEWLAGHIPDLWASTANDPRNNQYYARYTPSSEVKVVESLPYQVVITSKGLFSLINNTTIPLTYNLRYTFEIDGTVRVDLKVSAEEDIVLRWLTLMEASISRTCRFVSHDFDLGEESRTCNPTNYDVLDEKGIDVEGKFIPWFHFGNDRGGLELVFPYSDRRHGSYTDSSPFRTGDPLGHAWEMFTLKKVRSNLLCTAFGIRNHREVIGPNYSYEDTFFISALPGRTIRPDANSVQIQWIGPHQFRSNWKHPVEEDIKKWAAGGVNTIVGGANWFSGDYGNCSMPEETKQFLEICHRYGLRVIPYITFTDQEYPTPGFNETGPKGRIEPVTEFNYRSQLMCYGAEDWQEQWRKEVSMIFEQYPFDGLYIDFWAGKLNCYNTKHGCVGPYGRFTVEGLRRMARIAREIVDTKTKNGFILSNTNILPLAMINNWMDARLYGEWHNLEDTDPLALRIYYNAHRYGTGNVLLVSNVPKITERTLALSGLFQGNPVISHARTPDERYILERNALFLNAFGANKSIALNKFEMDELLGSQEVTDLSGVSLLYNKESGDLLVCLSSFSKPGSKVKLGPILENIMTKTSNLPEFGDTILKQAPYNTFIFENKTLIGGKPMSMVELAEYTLDLPAEGYKNIWIKPANDQPSVLYALNNGEAPQQEYKSQEATLIVTIPSKARQSAETAFLGKIPKSVGFSGGPLNFSAHNGWWEAELPCNADITVTY
jgi:hypothetical protein